MERGHSGATATISAPRDKHDLSPEELADFLIDHYSGMHVPEGFHAVRDRNGGVFLEPNPPTFSQLEVQTFP